ncbi:unnamed protein product [Phaedon cochleariae]|uniref:Homeobox domain-containing protein n=1 Tax=Phaedon cochleariae TaxID=80249 RepID=A0A9P0GRX7_PHACE|nr:unnamed protein product [Phaedon cochleariae]
MESLLAKTLVGQPSYHSQRKPGRSGSIPFPLPRNRTTISKEQAQALQAAFDKNPYYTKGDLEQTTRLPERVIKIWFQNRRRSVFTCEKCNKSYTKKKSLYYHLRRYCGKAPTYFCPEDGRRKESAVRVSSNNKNKKKTAGRNSKNITADNKKSSAKKPKDEGNDRNLDIRPKKKKITYKKSFYVRNGIQLKITRCIKCGSFLTKDRSECKRCELNVAMRILAKQGFSVIKKQKSNVQKNADTSIEKEKQKCKAPKKSEMPSRKPAGNAAVEKRKLVTTRGLETSGASSQSIASLKKSGSKTKPLPASLKKSGSKTKPLPASLKKFGSKTKPLTASSKKSGSRTKKVAVSRKTATKRGKVVRGKRVSIKRSKPPTPLKHVNLLDIGDIMNEIVPEKVCDENRLEYQEKVEESTEVVLHYEEDVQHVSFNDLINIIDD